MSWAHPFGTDQLGRDVFSRVIHGGRIVILLSLSGTFLGLVIGAAIGLFSGYIGGWIDDVLQRFLEALISIPFLVLALITIVAVGPAYSGNPVLLALVIALIYSPRIARMARAAAIEIVTRDHVTVAKLRGESAWSVIQRELLPNATSVLLVEFALRAGYAPVLIFLNERFPTALRVSGTGLSWNIGFALGGMMPTFVSLVSGSPAEIPMSLAYFAVGVFVIYLIGAVVIPETKGNFR